MPDIVQQVRQVERASETGTKFRLFSPIESDDARHDEALSSRIAALNMLDLSLDHLGLITRPDDEPKGEEGTVARGLNAIVDRIGDGQFPVPRGYAMLTDRTAKTVHLKLLDAEGKRRRVDSSSQARRRCVIDSHRCICSFQMALPICRRSTFDQKASLTIHPQPMRTPHPTSCLRLWLFRPFHPTRL